MIVAQNSSKQPSFLVTNPKGAGNMRQSAAINRNTQRDETHPAA
ncbi:hypothetical protein ANACOL_00829 [Anaerotruncus colihominis DSM 17241]|uniref:Uncharacterized protein n=1 Tax=Anaerotruncus colihominis DSM 17241 TaxID=445972 RepID=B0P7U0_9FIRM|nr:hypothetical protein ANACOL_00829 [Anaerotruncus colihominis DSM 17241]